MRLSFLLSLSLPTLTQAATITFQYTEASNVIYNPNRGFYWASISRNNSLNPTGDGAMATIKENAESFILSRIYDLNAFRGVDAIDAYYLNSMKADLDSIRSNGFTVILNFNYNEPDTWDPNPPYNDAPAIDRVLKHIAQLKPIMKTYEDIIFVVKFGIIGKNGDQYYTDLYGGPSSWWGGNETHVQWRKDIFNAYLDAVPSSRPVSIRTVGFKMAYLSSWSAVTADQAFNSTFSISRVGIFDGNLFYPAQKNFGTWYSNDELEIYKAESQYVLNGGLTGGNSASDYACNNARAEMTSFGISYLSKDWNTDVFEAWKTQGCFNELRDKLGYRYVLSSSSMTLNDDLSFNMVITGKNNGFASTYSSRTATLLVESVAWNGGSCSAAVPTIDIRRWKGNGTQFSSSVTFSFNSALNIPEVGINVSLVIADPLNTHVNSRVIFANKETQTTDRKNLLMNIPGPATIPMAGTKGVILECSGGVFAPKCYDEYVVKSGDYCWAIGNDNGLTVDELKACNPGLDCNNLQIGQKLCVNCKGPCYKKYTVVSGDNCWAIGNNNGFTSTDAFLECNVGLNCANLQIGQSVCVNCKNPPTTTSTAKSNTTTKSTASISTRPTLSGNAIEIQAVGSIFFAIAMISIVLSI